MGELNIEEIANSFLLSEYSVVATGIRNVNLCELIKLLEIIISGDDVTKRLSVLYKNSPATIELNKSWREYNCDGFSNNCDCFLPDIEFENCYCQVRKREKRLTDGKRNYPEYKIWRSSVFERDKYTCQKCKNKGVELNAHHIKSYAKFPELRTDIDNGVTLCIPCHLNEHLPKRNKAKV